MFNWHLKKSGISVQSNPDFHLWAGRCHAVQWEHFVLLCKPWGRHGRLERETEGSRRSGELVTASASLIRRGGGHLWTWEANLFFLLLELLLMNFCKQYAWKGWLSDRTVWHHFLIEDAKQAPCVVAQFICMLKFLGTESHVKLWLSSLPHVCCWQQR